MNGTPYILLCSSYSPCALRDLNKEQWYVDEARKILNKQAQYVDDAGKSSGANIMSDFAKVRYTHISSSRIYGHWIYYRLPALASPTGLSAPPSDEEIGACPRIHSLHIAVYVRHKDEIIGFPAQWNMVPFHLARM